MNNNIKKLIRRMPLIKNVLLHFHELKDICTYLQNQINVINSNIDGINCRVRNIENELLKIGVRINNVNNKSISLLSFDSIGTNLSKIKKVAVYTVIIGDYDYIKKPLHIDNEHFDYYCITDNKDLKSSFWNVVHIDSIDCQELTKYDNTRRARYLKTHPHLLFNEYGYSIFIDGNVIIKNSLYEWICKYYQKNMLISIHPERDCIYDEADACIAAKKDDIEAINKTVTRYEKESYPHHNGLVMANVIFREHNNETNNFCELWWDEIKNNSKRDQLSFNYIADKISFHYSISPLNAYKNKYYMCLSHCNDNFIRDYEYYSSVPDGCIAEELKVWYYAATGRKLNLETPVTFNEKLQWLKIYDNLDIKTILADKYLVREYIRNKIGIRYLIPLLGVYNSFDEICFDDLPNKFVIKCNHGSGMNIIVQDKMTINIENVRQIVNDWMHTNFAYVNGFEMQYKNIKPLIIVEENMQKEDGLSLVDYKIHCFNGVPKIIQVIEKRDYVNHSAKECFFDEEWNKVDLMYHTYDVDDEIIDKPKQLDELLEISKSLSANFKYVRVDLYIIDDKIYFGELTFTPASGIGKWCNESNNVFVGDAINIEDINV